MDTDEADALKYFYSDNYTDILSGLRITISFLTVCYDLLPQTRKTQIWKILPLILPIWQEAEEALQHHQNRW
jgi:hypothetical protein